MFFSLDQTPKVTIVVHVQEIGEDRAITIEVRPDPDEQVLTDLHKLVPEAVWETMVPGIYRISHDCSVRDASGNPVFDIVCDAGPEQIEDLYVLTELFKYKLISLSRELKTVLRYLPNQMAFEQEVQKRVATAIRWAIKVHMCEIVGPKYVELIVAPHKELSKRVNRHRDKPVVFQKIGLIGPEPSNVFHVWGTRWLRSILEGWRDQAERTMVVQYIITARSKMRRPTTSFNDRIDASIMIDHLEKVFDLDQESLTPRITHWTLEGDDSA